jgi:hypothetical protein
MFHYRITVEAPPSRHEPLAYSMAPRTVPTLVSRFTNPRPPVQNWTTSTLDPPSDPLWVSNYGFSR